MEVFLGEPMKDIEMHGGMREGLFGTGHCRQRQIKANGSGMRFPRYSGSIDGPVLLAWRSVLKRFMESNKGSKYVCMCLMILRKKEYDGTGMGQEQENETEFWND